MSAINLYKFERTLDVFETQNIIDSFLKNNRFTCKVVFSDTDSEVSHAILVDKNGTILSRGSGKGKNHLLGAQTEALEHYISLEKRGLLVQTSIKEVVKQKSFQKDFCIQALYQENPEENLKVEKFTNLVNEDVIWVPSGYVNISMYKDTKYKLNPIETHLGKFSTNNGCALGIKLQDSLLHGLNESIERHYESLLYQDIIGLRTGVTWFNYSDTTNLSYTRKCEEISKTFGKVTTIFAKTVANTFVAFTFLKNNDASSMAHIGAGSSLCFDLAVQRATDELAQCLTLYLTIASQDKEVMLDEERYFKTLKRYPGLNALVHFPADKIEKVTRGKHTNFRDKHKEKSTSEQLEKIFSSLAQARYTPTYKILHTEGNIFVTQVFVPEFDKFFVIRKGKLVAPSNNYQ